MAYFDNLGNELYEVVAGREANKVYFNWDKNLKYSTISPSIYYNDYNEQKRWKYYATIFDNAKPIKTVYISRDTTIDDITISLNDILCAYSSDNIPIKCSMAWHLKHHTGNSYVEVRIDGSNDYNSEVCENVQVDSINANKLDIDVFEIKLVGLIILDTDNNILGTLYCLIGRFYANGGYTDACVIPGTGTAYYYAPTLGGYKNVTWSGTIINPYDPEERDLDPSNNTSSGGGYGTGINYTDSVSIPSLPALNINVAGSSLYNLTNAQMLSFTTYLWSSDWQDNIKKLRTDPMQNIIGVSVTDIALTGNATSIKLGNLNTEVSANLVNNWVSVDCGEIELNEYYGSFADYEPYIALTLYLPKVGFVQIPADAVVNNTIKVVYNIELCSGEGICFVYITNKRDGFSYVYNTYTCHVTANVALSASDHTQQLSALINAGINTTTAIAGAIASGGATAGNAAMTVATSALDVATTKNPTITTGNIGNMGSMMCVKKPYLMINRTNLTKPSSFRENNGQLINYTAKISGHTGFLKTRDFHAEFDAPYSHKVEIERIMNEGVFING